MVIKKTLLSTFVAGMTLLLSCSDMNESTNLGSNILTSTDPSKTDFNANFSFFDSVPLSFVKSTARVNDTLVGVNRARVGTSISKCQARSMLSFRFDSLYRAKHLTDTLQSVTVYIEDTDADSAKNTAALSIFDYSRNRLASYSAIDSATRYATIQSQYKSGSFLDYYRDTLNTSALTNIKAMLSKVSKDTLRFKILLTSNYDSLMSLDPDARLILQYKSAKSVVVVDSLTSDSCNHVLIDPDSTDLALSTQAVTSSETGRKTIFSMDLSRLWDTLAKRPDFSTILSATLSIKDSMLAGSDTNSSKVNFCYYISPTLFTSNNIISDTLNSTRARYSNFTYDSTLAGTTELNLQAAVFFRSMLSKKPSIAYLYISNRNNNSIVQKTLWKNPVIKDITFTNFK